MIYLFLVMRQHFESRKSSRQAISGQATVEYVLTLIVTITLLLMVTAQIFRPLQTFLKDYMGTYVECLLETGELPALGGETAGVLADEGCRAVFSDGKYAGGGAGGSGADGAGSEAGRGRSGQAGSEEGGGSGGGGSSSASSSGAGRRGFLNGPRVRGSADGAANKNPKIVEISLGATQAAGFAKRSNSSAYGGRYGQGARPVITYGVTEEQRKKLSKEANTSNRTIAGEIMTPPKPKRINVKPPEKAQMKDMEAPAWSFGDYIRYFLIAAIIIVLGLLIGGQALRLAKGWEK